MRQEDQQDYELRTDDFILTLVHIPSSKLTIQLTNHHTQQSYQRQFVDGDPMISPVFQSKIEKLFKSLQSPSQTLKVICEELSQSHIRSMKDNVVSKFGLDIKRNIVTMKVCENGEIQFKKGKKESVKIKLDLVVKADRQGKDKDRFQEQEEEIKIEFKKQETGVSMDASSEQISHQNQAKKPNMINQLQDNPEKKTNVREQYLDPDTPPFYSTYQTNTQHDLIKIPQKIKNRKSQNFQKCQKIISSSPEYPLESITYHQHKEKTKTIKNKYKQKLKRVIRKFEEEIQEKQRKMTRQFEACMTEKRNQIRILEGNIAAETEKRMKLEALLYEKTGIKIEENDNLKERQQQIKNMKQELKNKTSLQLPKKNITAQEIKDILLSIKFEQITKITLDENSLGDEGVEELVKYQWPKLKVLSLKKNGISDRGAHNLLSTKWQSLTIVYLNNNQISEKLPRHIHNLMGMEARVMS